MAEDMYDQMLYGRRCKHGTNIGTPGGPELLCGYCESGLDTWVPKPWFELWFSATFDGVETIVPTSTRTGWRADDPVTRVYKAIRKMVDAHQGIADDSPYAVVFTYEVRQMDAGYWAE